MKSLSIAATGMLAQQRNVEVISNNIANLNTVGFKRQRAEFQDLLYQTIERAGAISSTTGAVTPNGVQIGAGVKTGSVYRITEQGNVTATGNDFDLAISGRGLFRVELPDGREAYTRAGNFAVSADGRVVTEDGYEVLPGVTVPEDSVDVSISSDGVVEARIAGEQDLREIGRLELVTFFNESGLEAIGDNLLLETSASGEPVIGSPGEEGFGGIM
ncbi:MAG: flagellar basal-body rod protein FlgG, partial [Parvularculaceae bacterium]|nr:flagellar basal-body rod protein FlgG [Parvularculaceae bacterium]